MLNSTLQSDGVTFSSSTLETALRISGLGKRSKQRFLKKTCTDSVIKRSRKGAGGNTVVYSCFIIKQDAVAEQTLKKLREGIIKNVVIRKILE